MYIALYIHRPPCVGICAIAMVRCQLNRLVCGVLAAGYYCKLRSTPVNNAIRRCISYIRRNNDVGLVRLVLSFEQLFTSLSLLDCLPEILCIMDQTFLIGVLLLILETYVCQDLRFVVFIVRLVLAWMIL